MKNKFVIPSVWLLLLLVSASSFAQQQFTRGVPRTPWHLINLWWTSPEETPAFNELAIDFKVVGAPSADVNLYIAPLGLTKIGKLKLYGGVQTHAGGWPSKAERGKFEAVGRAGIFSRWSPDRALIPLDYADGPEGTHYEAGGHEGNFISVRHSLQWGAGSYTYLLRRIGGNADPLSLWYSARVLNKDSGQEVEIGSLRFDSSAPGLDHAIASFLEIYGAKTGIPGIAVIFSEPKVDGRYRSSTSLQISYPNNGMSAPPRFATAFRVGHEVYIYLVPEGIRDGVGIEPLSR